MTTDDHPGMGTPVGDNHAASPSVAGPLPQPSPQQPDVPRPRAKRRAGTLLLVALLAIVALIGIRRLTASLLDPDPQKPTYSTPTVGYSGPATSTGSISSAWASGVETAWRIPFPSTQYGPRALTAVEGTTLYAFFEDPEYSAHQATVAAFDISSEQPRELWRTTGPLPASFARPEPVSLDQQLIVGSVVVDKATGTQSLAPWEGSEALAAVDGVVVACDHKKACSGWSQDSSSWVRRWDATTAAQESVRFGSTMITYPDTPVIGSGEHQSVVLPVSSERYLAQLIDPTSGQVTDVASLGPFRDRQHNVAKLALASDGIVAFNDDIFVTYDADGFIVGTQSYEKTKRMPTRDGRMPSTSELGEFLSGGLPTWSNATVTPQRAAVALTVTPSDGRTSFDLKPSNNDQFDGAVNFLPEEVRASTDTSVVYVESVDIAHSGNRFFFDTASGRGHGSKEFHDADRLKWPFDDLVIGVTVDGIVAFTPKAL